jgi:hypothetical protein
MSSKQRLERNPRKITKKTEMERPSESHRWSRSRDDELN